MSLPDTLQSFVEEQLASRGNGTSSQYCWELIRRNRDRQRLRGLLLDGAGSATLASTDEGNSQRLRERVRLRAPESAP